MVKKPVSTLILFGATGDLARRMLLPSLYGLHSDGLLPDKLKIIGTARSEHDDAEFRDVAETAVREFANPDIVTNASLTAFLKRVSYVTLDVSKPDGFARLAAAVDAPEDGIAIFLSTAPSLFEPTIQGLNEAGLAGSKTRLALEKPLGKDLASSREINDAVARVFPEDRTFRIDHYLGKETVQNLLALRFGNLMFEPLWNADGIQHVEILVAETVGLEGRTDYYDGMGALRDMVQNHLLQLLALVAMEPPASFTADAVRDEKVKILRALRPMTAKSVTSNSAVGQYDGYAKELGRDTATETFVALKAHIDNWRWKGVPFYIRTGKKMPQRSSEIFVQFKDVPHSIFAARGAKLEPNGLLIRLQPEETISLTLMAKVPGLDRDGIRLREVSLDLSNANAFADVRRRIAYERLMLDLIEGDPTLFVRRDEVEAQWVWIDAIRAGWTKAGMTPEPYQAGSQGPPSAATLGRKDGLEWHD